MGLVIKRRVSLDFLGEEYKDSCIVFKAIPVVEYQKVLKNAEEIGEDNAKSITFILETLKKYFIEGKFQGTALIKEDLDSLDVESAVKCFEVLSGQTTSPKEPATSENTSSTATPSA